VVALNESLIVVGLKAEHKLAECNYLCHNFSFLRDALGDTFLGKRLSPNPCQKLLINWFDLVVC
jgi:hypothetical protein